MTWSRLMMSALGVPFWLAGALAWTPAARAANGEGAPVLAPLAPTMFTADLSVDLQANTYFFAQKHTTFALELSPRFGVLVANFIDLGVNFIAGYAAKTQSWAQATMFGIGPYVGFRVPIGPKLRLTPWVAVNYHQTFFDSFEPTPATLNDPTDNIVASRQLLRVDLHCDLVLYPQARTAFTVGVFAKTRAASFDSGLGQSPELDAGLRIGAISYF